jgi:hypothetical protein
VALASIVGALFLLVVGAIVWLKPATAVAAADHAEPSAAAPSAGVPSVAAPSVAAPSVAIPTASAAPAPELSSKPAASAAAPVFRGTRATTRVTWSLGGGVYTGVITTKGTTGYVDVHTIEPGAGPVVIREDLRLQRSPRGWTYVGSNPRYLDEGIPANFIPNVFYLEQGPNGAWTFVETCALGTGACTRVQSGS